MTSFIDGLQEVSIYIYLIGSQSFCMNLDADNE